MPKLPSTKIVVPDGRVSAVVAVVRGGAAARSTPQFGGRQSFPYRIVGIVIVNAAADHQVVG